MNNLNDTVMVEMTVGQVNDLIACICQMSILSEYPDMFANLDSHIDHWTSVLVSVVDDILVSNGYIGDSMEVEND
jgi:hypothetical protein